MVETWEELKLKLFGTYLCNKLTALQMGWNKKGSFSLPSHLLHLQFLTKLVGTLLNKQLVNHDSRHFSWYMMPYKTGPEGLHELINVTVSFPGSTGTCKLSLHWMIAVLHGIKCFRNNTSTQQPDGQQPVGQIFFNYFEILIVSLVHLIKLFWYAPDSFL